MVQILYNYYGENCGTNSGFSDVPSSVWYAKAVTWASKKGVVSGYSNGTFGPNNKLTREQMVTILYRWAQQMGYDVSGRADLSAFPDNASVAAYATEPMTWAIAEGIISGTTEGLLNPAGTATRAQFAVILYRFFENVM